MRCNGEEQFVDIHVMSDLLEYHAEEDSCGPSENGKSYSAKNLLVDLNRMDEHIHDKNIKGDTDTTLDREDEDEDERPRFRIGDLFSIMSQEIALKEQQQQTQQGEQQP
jgi:hypothetical protein